MRADFTKCMPVILQYEGGFSNHPADPGGVTLEGIIQRVYNAYRDRKGLPHRALTPAMRGQPDWVAERNEIYLTQYWNAVRGDELRAGVDLVVFDGAVNSGPHQSVLWLQRALAAQGLYHGPADGTIGEGTLAALEACTDDDALIADILSRRLGMLRSLKTFSVFGDGWTRRVLNLKKIGQAWAMGSVGPAPAAVQAESGNAKAYVSDVAQPLFDAGDATKISAGGGGVTAVVKTAQDQLAPLVGTNDVMTHVYTALVLLGLAIAVVGIFYSIYAHAKTKRAQRAIEGDVVYDAPEAQPA